MASEKVTTGELLAYLDAAIGHCSGSSLLGCNPICARCTARNNLGTSLLNDAPRLVALLRSAEAMKTVSRRLDGMDGQATEPERQIIEWSDEALAALEAVNIEVSDAITVSPPPPEPVCSTCGNCRRVQSTPAEIEAVLQPKPCPTCRPAEATSENFTIKELGECPQGCDDGLLSFSTGNGNYSAPCEECPRGKGRILAGEGSVHLG